MKGDNAVVGIDDCLGNPCGSNGTCVNLVVGYTCNCSVGYTGTNCENGKAPVTTTILLRFNSNSTALRPFDDIRYDLAAALRPINKLGQLVDRRLVIRRRDL